MAKRKEDPPPAGSPAWMSTFSDLMNLLFCFFVLLYAMSSVDEEKFEQVVASFSKSFSIFDGGASSIGDGMLVSNGVSQLNELSEYINSTGAGDTTEPDDDKVYITGEEQVLEEMEEMQMQASEELAEKIAEAADDYDIAEDMSIEFNSQYVKLTLKGNLLFDSGDAVIKSDAYPVLEKLSVILEKYADNEIVIEGHTDNVPQSSGKYPSNNELSTARALAVFYYLTDHSTLNPAHISYSGRGEYIPIADNSTPEGRTLNRRVEIKIYHELSSNY